MTTNTAFGLALTKPFIMKTQIEIEDLNKGPIIIFFSLMADDFNLRQDIKRGSLDGNALMEPFLDEITPLRNWYINPNEKRIKCRSSLLRKP